MGKIEEWARRTLLPMMKKINFEKTLKEETINKIFEAYIKTMKLLFKTITIITISLTFLWFLPTKLGLGTEKTILISLVTIMIHLRIGKTKVSLE
jgi:hypothetical protein